MAFAIAYPRSPFRAGICTVLIVAADGWRLPYGQRNVNGPIEDLPLPNHGVCIVHGIRHAAASRRSSVRRLDKVRFRGGRRESARVRNLETEGSTLQKVLVHIHTDRVALLPVGTTLAMSGAHSVS